MKKYLLTFLITVCTLSSPSYGEKPFVSANLHAQLGNQCFEIAAALALAWDNDAEPIFPDLYRRKHDNIPLNRKEVFWRLNAKPYPKQGIANYREPYYHYRKIPYQPNLVIYGYFQSEKYFRHHKEAICALFQPKKEIVNYLTEKYGHFLNHPTTVSIHVRTYNREDPRHKWYCLNGRRYIENALTHFPKDALFLVFSDDIPWCKKRLKGVAENLHFIEGEAHYHDFYLMSLCDHNIISNSTFSWWGAYLNQNPNKIVIAPTRWFKPPMKLKSKDLIPPEWIREDHRA